MRTEFARGFDGCCTAHISNQNKHAMIDVSKTQHRRLTPKDVPPRTGANIVGLPELCLDIHMNSSESPVILRRKYVRINFVRNCDLNLVHTLVPREVHLGVLIYKSHLFTIRQHCLGRKACCLLTLVNQLQLEASL